MNARALRAAKREGVKLEDEHETKKPKLDVGSPCPSLADDKRSFDFEGISDLEAERMAIMAANQSFLRQLGLHDDKARLHISVMASKPKKQPTKGITTKRTTYSENEEPPRRSGRLSGAKPAGFYIDSETASHISFVGPDGEPVLGEAAAMAQETARQPKATPREIPEVLTLQSTSTTDKHGADFLESLRELSMNAVGVPPVSSSVMSFAAKVSRMQITAESVAKVVPERIYSTAFHPSPSKVLAVAGDKEGNIGIWDVDSRDNDAMVFLYRPHNGVVGALQYAPGDATKLWSWSYDCSVRCMDIVKQEFQQMFLVDENVTGWIQHGSISEGDPNTMHLATSNGLALGVDVRQCGAGYRNVTWRLQAHTKKCNSVHASPTAPHFLATGGLDGCINVWDLRHVGSQRPKPLASFAYKRTINSAFFNPVGSHLLAVTQNDTICLYPDKCWTGDAKAAGAIPTILKHDNQTGRWLSSFHGVWNPREPHAFLVGSMQQPRCMEVYSTDGGGRRIGVLRGDYLTSVCSRNCWHPALDILCGGNSSGRLHIFR